MFNFLNKHLEECFGAVLLAVMAVVAFLNVIVRYCTSFSFAWSEELTINLFVWIVLLGTACAFRENSNLGMSIIYNNLPRSLRKICYYFSVLLCVFFFVALCWTGTIEILDEIELESSSESLNIPVWLYTIATPLLSLLVIFRLLQRFWEDLRNGNF